MSLMPGQVLQGRYTIQALLGQGGFGAVYQAHDGRLNQTVALKENLGGDPRQFQQEALLLANLRHPNLPRVSDHFVEPNGAQYLVMDFVAGEDLEARVQRQGALKAMDAVRWITQVLDAVAYLHGMGVIHRDIKPANIKITPGDQAVLVDFGIAKLVQPGMRTLTGAKAVSAGYAAPEQYRGGTDQRSDVYSLGATLYAILVGGDPPDAQARERGIATLTSPRALNSGISAQTEQVIMRALAVPPQQRFQSAMDMRFALAAAPMGHAQALTSAIPSASGHYASPVQVATAVPPQFPSPPASRSSAAAPAAASAQHPIVLPIVVGSGLGVCIEIASWIPVVGVLFALANLVLPLGVGIWSARRRRVSNFGRLTYGSAFGDGIRSGVACSVLPSILSVVEGLLFYYVNLTGNPVVDVGSSFTAGVVVSVIGMVIRLLLWGVLGAVGGIVYRGATGA